MSEVFEVNVGMHQGCVLSHFSILADVIELAREGYLSELMYVDDLVLMSEITEGLINSFKNLSSLWKAKV